MATITYNWITIASSSSTILTNDPINNSFNEFLPAITALSNGSYIASWTGNVGGNTNVSAKILSSTGAAISPQFVVNSTVAGSQLFSSLTQLSNGNFVATFVDQSADLSGDVRFRLFNPSGTALGSDVLIANTSGSRQETSPDVIALSGGGFVIAVQTRVSGDDHDISYRRYSNDGQIVGVATVDASTALATTEPSIARLASGGFVISWIQGPTNNPSFDTVLFQQFNDAGQTVGGHQVVSATGPSIHNLDSVGLQDGGFALTYEDNAWGTGTHEIILRIYNADGSPRTSAFIANNSTAFDQLNPSITQLSNGFIVVSYSDGSNMRYRAFDPSGSPIAPSMRTGAFVIDGVIAALNGGLIGNVHRSSLEDDGGNQSIRSQVNELIRTTTGDPTDETLLGDSLRDTITGNDGNDSIDGGGNSDTMDGGAGIDTVSWALAVAGVTLNLDNQALNAGAAAGDTVSNFEIFSLTNFADTLIGSNAGVTAIGLGGNDSLTGGDGNDNLDGGAGNDTANGGGGADVIFAGDGDDLSGGGAGDDIILGQDGNDTIDGADGSDSINAGNNDDVIFGGIGNDTIGGGAGNDTILGQDGEDVIFGEDGIDVANAGAGNDIMVGGLGNDTFGAGSDNDVIIGGDGDDLIFGEEGIDNMNGEFGADGVVGGAGDDILGGGAGDDIVVGQDGNDVLFGETGNDAMNGEFGNDILLGSDGDDVIGGGAGDDDLNGGFGDDTIFGENGNDILNGSAGNDVLIGGGNDDVFVFAPGDGNDTVGDFFAGDPEDRLWFNGTSLHSFGDVLANASQAGGNTVITYNGFFNVTLNGVTTGQLTAEDFIFT